MDKLAEVERLVRFAEESLADGFHAVAEARQILRRYEDGKAKKDVEEVVSEELHPWRQGSQEEPADG